MVQNGQTLDKHDDKDLIANLEMLRERIDNSDWE
jgi:hypothetical protein